MHPLLPITGIATVVLAFGIVIGHAQSETAYSVARPTVVAGIQYDLQGARALDELGDAPVISALPPSQRRASPGQALYGVFITLSNGGARPRPMSRHFSLVDEDDHAYGLIALRPDSPFAYRARDLAGGRVTPASDSAPAQDLADQGYPLVFRIPRSEARDGSLTLRVFDPTGATPPAEIAVQVV
jgi:hypothetical protein